MSAQTKRNRAKDLRNRLRAAARHALANDRRAAALAEHTPSAPPEAARTDRTRTQRRDK